VTATSIAFSSPDEIDAGVERCRLVAALLATEKGVSRSMYSNYKKDERSE